VGQGHPRGQHQAGVIGRCAPWIARPAPAAECARTEQPAISTFDLFAGHVVLRFNLCDHARVAVSQDGNIKGTSDETHCARGARAGDLRHVCNRAFRSGQSDRESRAHHTADDKYDDAHVSGQLRYAGDDLSECLHSDHRGGAGKSRRVREQRRLQSQLHQPAACLQTALLKARSRADEGSRAASPSIRGPIMFVGNAGFGAAALGPSLLIDLEATPGIEPGYTVLQSGRWYFCKPLTLTQNLLRPLKMPISSMFFWTVHGKLLHFAAACDSFLR